MDELTMVRRLLAERPPAAHVVAAGRERLLGPPTRRRASRRGALVLGLTLAATAAALLVGTLGSSPGGGGPLITEASARTVLLAAAVHAESAPTSGADWHVRSLSSTTLPRRFGHGENRYTLEQLSVRERWAARTGEAWSGSREWVRPKTPEDEAAWRRDGAPSTWCTGRTDTEPARPICLRTAPGTASLRRDYFPFEVAEGHELSFAQLQRLPDDPGALRAWLVGMTRHDLDPSASADIVDIDVTQILANLLVDLPVPPTVRAAAYRALADMRNVTSIGSTHDQRGRTGVGIQIAEGWAGSMFVLGDAGAAVHAGPLTRTLIIDPATSHVLADETSTGNRVVTDTLILDVGWTNGKPHEPALP
jgi:hypothetical protein